jgi:nucleotidyltransferase/DNA polymerase involved in DNA repair
MNPSTADNGVQWLFLDLNAFFASCEQQEAPALRGKPVIVVQTLTDSAIAIAASYAAKAYGIKTERRAGYALASSRCRPITGSIPSITIASSKQSTPACRSRRSCRSTKWHAG